MVFMRYRIVIVLVVALSLLSVLYRSWRMGATAHWPSLLPGEYDDDSETGSLSSHGLSKSNKALDVLNRPPPSVYSAGDIHVQHEYKFGTTRGGYRWLTEARLRALAACAARGDCHANAHKVVIFGAYHCHLALFDQYRGGEGVWCMGMVKSLERQGYTVLFAKDDWAYIYHIYRQIPDLVRAVIADPADVNNPQDETKRYTNFIKTANRLDGIPAWKFFYFYYYPNPFNTVVGNKWVVTAEPAVPGDRSHLFTYLGYALEGAGSANPIPTIPFDKRPHRVWLLGKYTWFFGPSPMAHPVWDSDFYQRVTTDLRKRWPDFEIVAGMVDFKDTEGQFTIPDGIRNLGKLNSVEFDRELSQSRLLLGIGYPGLSPSPYRALAMGVPFLNPNWSPVESQHTTLRTLDEPLVYNVKAFDYDAFLAAITKAMETEVQPWSPPWMSEDALDKRMRDFIEHDWRADAAEILEQRLAGNETQLEQVPDMGGALGIFEL